jgi:hypothetical protein
VIWLWKIPAFGALKKSKNACEFELGQKGINRIFAQLFTESNTESN